MVTTMIYLIPVAGLIGFLFTYLRTKWILKQDGGTTSYASFFKPVIHLPRSTRPDFHPNQQMHDTFPGYSFAWKCSHTGQRR